MKVKDSALDTDWENFLIAYLESLFSGTHRVKGIEANLKSYIEEN